MTQKEAIIKVLKELGGRAKLTDIYPRVIKLVYFKPDSDMQATIRAIMLRDPTNFRRTEGKKGWWELTSYQEEIVCREEEIARLKAEVDQLKTIKTEDDFVKKLLAVTKRLYKRDEEELDVIRKLLYTVGRKDAEEELDAWIEGRENKHAVAIGKVEIRQGGTNIGTNYGPNIENNGGMLSLPDNDNKNG